MLRRIGITSNAIKDVSLPNGSASSAWNIVNEHGPRKVLFPTRYRHTNAPRRGNAGNHFRYFSNKSDSPSRVIQDKPEPVTLCPPSTNPTQSIPSPESETPFPTLNSPKPVTSPRQFLPKPDPTSAHSTLQTFLAYAQRTSLSPTSTTYLGTRYEYLTLEHLTTQLNFNLTRTGGRGDSGIDLLGTWPLPAILRGQDDLNDRSTSGQDNSNTGGSEADDAIRVLIQCKRLARAAGPNLIRELEGSFRGAPIGWRGENALGVMVCSRAATKGVRDAMGRSTRGLVWIMLEEIQPEQVAGFKSQYAVQAVTEELRQDDGKGRVSEADHSIPQVKMRQFLFNAAAALKCGLEGVNIGMRYDETGNQKDVQLMWQGSPINFSHQQADGCV